MSTDLTKMVEDAISKYNCNERATADGLTLLLILKAVAAEFDANREEIEKLKTQDKNPYLLSEEEIERMRVNQ